MFKKVLDVYFLNKNLKGYLMKLTLKLLETLNACKSGIKWAEQNSLIGREIQDILGIKGDYYDYLGLVKGE